MTKTERAIRKLIDETGLKIVSWHQKTHIRVELEGPRGKETVTFAVSSSDGNWIKLKKRDLRHIAEKIL